MQVPASVKPAIWGAIGGAVAAMIIGFVAKGEQQPEQLVLLKKESSWSRGDFVIKAGWVGNVNEKYRYAVARTCASTLVEAMDAKPAT
jgi:hypothetical protein